VRKKKREINTHTTLREGIKTQANHAFAIDNAANVFEMTSLATTPELTMPLSFAYQTVNATQGQSEESPPIVTEVTLRGKTSRFKDGLANLERNVLPPSCPLEESVSPMAPPKRKKKKSAKVSLDTPKQRIIPTGNIFTQFLFAQEGQTLTTANTALLQTPLEVKQRDRERPDSFFLATPRPRV
jgi:hypothetical protein